MEQVVVDLADEPAVGAFVEKVIAGYGRIDAATYRWRFAMGGIADTYGRDRQTIYPEFQTALMSPVPVLYR